MNSSDPHDFSCRLNELYDEAQPFLRASERPFHLAEISGLPIHLARNALSGRYIPNRLAICAIANHFNSWSVWLVSGRGDKYVNLDSCPDLFYGQARELF